MYRQCFVYFTRLLGAGELRQVHKLVEELSGIADLHVLSYQAIPDERIPLHVPGTKVPVTVVTRTTLDRYFSSYPGKYHSASCWQLMPGNTDLPQIAFSFLQPHYDYYWFCEDDVVFTGRMGELVAHFNAIASDLLATSWRTMPSHWHHRESLKLPASRAIEWQAEHWRQEICFMPLYRASARFFQTAHDYYLQGLSGHYEITWPFIVHHSNLDGCDINELGHTFYTSNLHSEGLAPGTFVYRPSRASPGRRPNTLYHPVKPLKEVLTHRLKALYWRFFA